ANSPELDRVRGCWHFCETDLGGGLRRLSTGDSRRTGSHMLSGRTRQRMADGERPSSTVADASDRRKRLLGYFCGEGRTPSGRGLDGVLDWRRRRDLNSREVLSSTRLAGGRHKPD